MQRPVNIMLIALAFLCGTAAAQSDEPKKCATFDRFRIATPPGIDLKVKASARPDLQTSVLSPMKHFRVHYDTTGLNVPAMVTAQGLRIEGTAVQYVDTVARIFDSVWTAEVTTFGFAPPPSDNGEGGGSEYDIYIEARSSNDFGETVWDDSAPIGGTTAAPRYKSYIAIDNDYGVGFRTTGLAGVMSTAAHEFHHAIQVGGYGLWTNDLYFYELTAEAMEPTVFPYSKDYVKDIATYFSNIENISLYTPFASYAGYERAIWSIFLMKRYGVGVMREIWEAMTAEEPVPAMKAVLERKGTTLPMEFSEFCFWNYYTGSRADTVLYYPDAKLFPHVNVREKQTLSASPVLFQHVSKGFSVNYLQVMRNADTASFIIANTNMGDALGSQAGSYGYQLRVSSSPGEGGAKLPNGMYAAFSAADPANWKFITLAMRQYFAECFPNPFRPSLSKFFIRLNADPSAQARPVLSVYSSSYNRVFSGAVDVEISLGLPYAVWNGITEIGDVVASGVYIYILQAGGEVTKGKFAVIR